MPHIKFEVDEATHDRIHETAAQYNLGIRELLVRATDAVREEPGLLLCSSVGTRRERNPTPRFRFIDLFAGIGGIRLAYERQGGECVFSCERDKYSQKTYAEYFHEIPHGDIKEVDPEKVPDHEVLTAGFPCQPFSIAGVSKKKSLGRDHGFKDAAQGTLFFDVAKILEVKRPPVLMLENVKNLRSHDGGRTYRVIEGALRELGYHVTSVVTDARAYVPQHRERIFILGFHRSAFLGPPAIDSIEAPEGPAPVLGSVLESKVDQKYVLSDKLWQYLQDYAENHRRKGNGFGFGLCRRTSVARTLSARYFKDGSEILVYRGPGKNPRRLTPRECARLMGFPDDFPIVVSDTQAYKQFGNSVVVPQVEAIARLVVSTLESAARPAPSVANMYG